MRPLASAGVWQPMELQSPGRGTSVTIGKLLGHELADTLIGYVYTVFE
jgi:hypothetical protein